MTALAARPGIHHALVTGASGFVGRRLCGALLARGVRVTALQRRSRGGPWAAELAIDLGRDEPLPALPADVDTVFHLAGFAHAVDAPEDASRHQRVTVEGTRRLLRACGASVRRFVYFSSVKAMGESTPPQGYGEEAEPRPASAYGRARLLAEGLVLGARERMHVVVLRLPLIYGPGVKGNLRRMLEATARGRLPLLPEFGNRRSMVHVDDVCAAALLAAETPAAGGRVYLLTDGTRYSSRQMQLLIAAAAGADRRPWTVPRWVLTWGARGGDLLRCAGLPWPAFDSRALSKLAESACYDDARARRELGFAPAHTFEEALPAMLDALGREPGEGGA